MPLPASGVDANGYMPVSAEQIASWFQGIEPGSYRGWREWLGE